MQIDTVTDSPYSLGIWFAAQVNSRNFDVDVLPPPLEKVGDSSLMQLPYAFSKKNYLHDQTDL